MIVAGLQDFSCNSDVTYFPFDNHACAIQLLTMEYDSDVILLATPVGVCMEYMLPNTEWEDYQTGNMLHQNCTKHLVNWPWSSWLLLCINILQKMFWPNFLLLNLVLPIIFLSFVNLLVFCIPVNSGERASLAFTVLLTFVVYITMETAILPPLSTVKHSFLLFFKIFTNRFGHKSSMSFSSHLWKVVLFIRHLRTRLLTDFFCLYNYEFWLSLCKIFRSSVILLLPFLSIKLWSMLMISVSENFVVESEVVFF
jgi:hypothetical protein